MRMDAAGGPQGAKTSPPKPSARVAEPCQAGRRVYNVDAPLQLWRAAIPSYNLCIVGFGSVARAFVSLLQRKHTQLERDYGIAFRIAGVASRRIGWLAAREGFSVDKLLTGDFSEAHKCDGLEPWLRAAGAEVLFETSSLNAHTGEPAIEHIRAALESGAHAITANKGPVVHAWRELTELAAQKGRRFLFESTVMDGVPVFSLFREAMPAIELRGFRGVLNSTTNVILEGLESGLTFDDSVRKAQELGVAESDPTDDIEGVDAAVKVIALANVLMQGSLRLQDVQRVGIRSLTADKLRAARGDGHAWKLVCRAQWRPDGSIEASVRPERLKLFDPLAQVAGTSSVISFETDVLPELIITENDPGLETTAYGLLADFVAAVRRA